MSWVKSVSTRAATSSSLSNQSSCRQSIISHCCFNWMLISNESNVLQTNPCLANQWSFGDVTHYTMPRYTWTASVFTKKLSLWFSANIMAESSCLLLEMWLKQLRILHMIFIYQFVQSFGQIIVYWSAPIVVSRWTQWVVMGSLSVMKKVQMGWTFCERFS